MGKCALTQNGEDVKKGVVYWTRLSNAKNNIM
jgi:hypothetical protein